MSKETILNVTRAILPLLRPNCDAVHCLDERALFFSSFGVVFSQFLTPDALKP